MLAAHYVAFVGALKSCRIPHPRAFFTCLAGGAWRTLSLIFLKYRDKHTW